jgi:hypothetical protein
MAGACDLPQGPLQSHVAEDFAVAATGSTGGLAAERLATDADGQVVVAFAGLLYEEDVARKQRPAAYCLELYQRHGPGFAVHLNGTFAVAIHDRPGGQLHLITDRMASRALYTHTDSPLVFGTEVKFLLEYPGMSRQVNPDRLREFLLLESLLGTATYYDHIRQVPGATVMTWQGGRWSEARYWAPQFAWDRHGSVDDHARQIAEALRHALRRVCAGHERLGLMLSAGLDSRATACASERPLTCMTMHTRRGSEVILAARVAQALGYPHHFLPLAEAYPLELVTAGSLIGDGMHGFQHGQGWLTRALVEQLGLSLLLNGGCLDGVFAGKGMPTGNERGWRRCLPPAMPPASAVDPVRHLLHRFQTAPDAWLDALFVHCPVAEVKRQVERTIAQTIAEVDAHACSNYDLITWVPLANTSKLRSILNVSSYGRFVDEGILLYDHETIAAYLALPPHYRFDARAYGRAIRMLNAEVAAIPRSGTCLPLPRSRGGEIGHYYRARFGAAVAERRARLCGYRRHDRNAWPRLQPPMRRYPEWHHLLRQHVEDSYLVDTGILAGDRLRELVEDQIAGRRNATNLVCAWLTLEEWLGRYG